ncbi:hypothetical protein MRX96_020486 [Rhipicephalus microplus]
MCLWRMTAHKFHQIAFGYCMPCYLANRDTEILLQLNGSTHVGHIRTSWGGVGRNVADCLSRLLGDPVRLVSAVGIDTNGEALLKHNPLLLLGFVRFADCTDGAASTDSTDGGFGKGSSCNALAGVFMAHNHSC